MSNEWLQQLKVGDEVFIWDGYSHIGPIKVLRLTKTLVVIERHGRDLYRRQDGRARTGSVWARRVIVKDTPEIRAKIALSLKYNKADSLMRSVVIPKDNDGLDRFIAAIEPFQRKG